MLFADQIYRPLMQNLNDNKQMRGKYETENLLSVLANTVKFN